VTFYNPAQQVGTAANAAFDAAQSGSGDREGRVGLAKNESAAAAAAAAADHPAIDINDPAQVRWRQAELRNLGADIVPNGVWDTKTAMLDYAVRHGTFVPPAKPPAAPAPTPARQAGGGGGAPASGGASSAPPPPLNAAQFKAQITASYPALAGLLDIPDIAAEIDKAIAAKSTPAELAANIMATDWWRSTPASTRQWISLQVTDPATAARQVEDNKAKLKSMADAYLVPVSDGALSEWSRKELSGEVPQDGFLSYVKEQAKSLFPTLSAAIDRGVTVAQYSDPYKQLAAQVLEVSPESISLADPKWSRALTNVDPKTGDRAAMSLYDWQALLKTDPQYGYDRTQQGRQEGAQLADKILQTFGRTAP
jgi:hypothetical protein